jgi:osmotically-inducible protein OsmY|tara:strand:- start:8939 stop:9256 length:318 start_codon:yes stop_codon:yes gene_type:complete
MNKFTKYFLLATTIAAMSVVGGCSKPPVASETLGHVSDNDVSENVKAALIQNESLKVFDIKVVTRKGDVRLTGMLDSQAQKDEAIRIALASEGAHTLHDELTVKK